jgi:hypothetical protein
VGVFRARRGALRPERSPVAGRRNAPGLRRVCEWSAFPPLRRGVVNVCREAKEVNSSKIVKFV